MVAGFPIFWMLVSSFKTNVEIFAYPPRLITPGFSLDAYTSVLTDPVKLRFFVNSYVVALAVTALTLVISVLGAFAFSRYEFRGKSPISIVIVGMQAVPPITLLIPYFSLIVALKLYNSYLGLILTYMVFTVPYAVILMIGYFNTLPRELDEAVKVDGGGTAHRARPGPGPGRAARPGLGRGLHVHDRVERVPVRPDPHPHHRHADAAHRHPAASWARTTRTGPS